MYHIGSCNGNLMTIMSKGNIYDNILYLKYDNKRAPIILINLTASKLVQRNREIMFALHNTIPFGT